jgi:hypothetical protein
MITFFCLSLFSSFLAVLFLTLLSSSIVLANVNVDLGEGQAELLVG